MILKDFSKKFWVSVFTLLLIFSLSQCKKSDKQPVISSISPEWILAKKATSIVVEGTNFDTSCQIIANGEIIPTQFVSENELRGSLSEELTVLPLTLDSKQINISVRKLIDHSDETIDSDSKTIELRHVPKCSNPTLIYQGTKNLRISNLNLLRDNENYIVLIFTEKDETTNKTTKKFMVSTDFGENWDTPKKITGILFLYKNNLYNISSSGEIYKSEDRGNSWILIGNKPKIYNSFMKEYLRWIGDTNLIYTYSIQKPIKVITLFTYKSTDLGKTWEFVSNTRLDFSSYFDDLPLEPSGAFMNKNGVIRIEYNGIFNSKFDKGMSAVSFDSGKTYEIVDWAFTFHSFGYLLDNNDLTGIKQDWYEGFVMNELFYYNYKAGTVKGYESDVRELIPSYEGNSFVSLDVFMQDHYFINRGNMMVCSYDRGENWSVPAPFITNFPNNSKLVPFFTETGAFFIFVVSPENNILLCASSN